MIQKKDIFFYLTAIGIFILLKFVFANAETNDMRFLLSPTNKIVGLLTGSTSVFIEGSGYFYKQHHIIIDKSCSGFNFWLLCFMMLTFLVIKFFDKIQHKILALIFSFIGAYILTILVNGSRIFASIIIQKQNISFAGHHIIHESIGIITNLTFLILIYLIVEKTIINLNTNEKLTKS